MSITSALTTLVDIFYIKLLQDKLPVLLENVILIVRQNMWSQHDGGPVHYSTITRKMFNWDFNDCWIDKSGPVNWPTRSTELTSPYFFLWGYLKNNEYAEVLTTPQNIIEHNKNDCANLYQSSVQVFYKNYKYELIKALKWKDVILSLCFLRLQLRIEEKVNYFLTQYKNLLNWRFLFNELFILDIFRTMHIFRDMYLSKLK